ALTEKVYQEGARIFIELGARDNCSRHIKDILGERRHLCVNLNKKGLSDKQSLLRAIARLQSHGVSINLSRLYKAPETKVNKKELWVRIEAGGKRVFDEMAALQTLKHADAASKAGMKPLISRQQAPA